MNENNRYDYYFDWSIMKINQGAKYYRYLNQHFYIIKSHFWHIRTAIIWTLIEFVQTLLEKAWKILRNELKLAFLTLHVSEIFNFKKFPKYTFWSLFQLMYHFSTNMLFAVQGNYYEKCMMKLLWSKIKNCQKCHFDKITFGAVFFY